MKNSTGLRIYFWLSLIVTIVGGFVVPFASGDFYTGIFVMVFVAPIVGLTTLATNIALICCNPQDPLWKITMASLLTLVGITAYALVGPSSSEIWARHEKAAYQKSSDAYFASLKKGDYKSAEEIFVKSATENASDFAFEIVCETAAKNPDGLAFTIRLQNRLKDKLVHRSEKPCRAIPWAVERGDIAVARIAVENGEIFSQWSLEATVAQDFHEKTLSEEQQIAFYELAAQHTQVSATLMASLLASAVKNKSSLLVRAIVKSAGGLNRLPDRGGAAMIAAGRTDWSSIEALLNFGADVNVIGENRVREHSTALVELLESGNSDPEIVAKLFARGASVRLPQGRGLLALALERCDVPVASLLLKHGADPNAADLGDSDRLPLRLALACMDDDDEGDTAKDFVRILLKRGAKLNPSYEHGWHLLADVCVNEPKRTVDFLRTLGADINARDKEGKTVLMSDFDDSPYIARKLLECGANVNAKDHHGWTALQYMHQRKYESSLKLLCDSDARPRALCTALPAAKT